MKKNQATTQRFDRIASKPTRKPTSGKDRNRFARNYQERGLAKDIGVPRATLCQMLGDVASKTYDEATKDFSDFSQPSWVQLKAQIPVSDSDVSLFCFVECFLFMLFVIASNKIRSTNEACRQG